MEFKGTSGKWFMDESESGKNEFDVQCNVISTITNVGLKIVGLAEVFGSDITAKANTQLIASAPELLEMLKRMMVNYDKGTQTYLDCQELIKKATTL